jgi:two-component system, cell cycle sensor histidine kinase and response regulator CckA
MREAIAAQNEYPNAGKGSHAEPVKQTILLVEDEEMVRSLMCEVLEREGYRVLACSHPAEGIEESKRYCGKIDLLLTDVVMPGMNGREMADRIHETLPQLRVVFMSGYTEHALTREGQVDPQFEYLQKPFMLKSLTEKLAKVLGNLDEQAS